MNTPSLDDIRAKYTKIQQCVVGGEDELHYTVWLKVGPQSFCTTSTAYEKEDEAEWMRMQLAKALQTMLQENNPAPQC